MSLSGQVAMVTGAASGIGAATARALAARGAVLALSDVDAAGLARLARETGAALAQPLDVTAVDAVNEHVAEIEARLGPLRLAVNSAGVAHPFAALEDTPPEMFDRVVAVNLRGAFLCLQAQIRRMKAHGQGSIVMLASAAGLAGAGRLAAYAASKHGVIGLMRSAAEEGARHNVRVNAVCPSFTQTPMLDSLSADMVARHGAADAQTRLSARVPMGRAATPEEVVQAVLWALEPANSFLTGAALPIDGGLTAL